MYVEAKHVEKKELLMSHLYTIERAANYMLPLDMGRYDYLNIVLPNT